MSERREEALPADVEQVRGRLTNWRGQRRRGQRIPQGLWAAAVRAGRRHGVYRVSRALGLDYGSLKRRIDEGWGEGMGQSEAEAMFVELSGPRPEAGGRCVVELEKGNGAKLRVSVGDAAAVDWCRIKEAFLGA